MQDNSDTTDVLLLPTGFDWYLLIGDESGLPAIVRELKCVPFNYRIAVILEVERPASHIDFKTDAHPYIEWYYRAAHGARDFMLGLEQLYIPPGEGFVWAVGEHGWIESVKNILLTHHDIDVSLAT